MRRQWAVPRDRDLEGSDRSLELAQALAVKVDPDTLEKLVELVSLLHSIGGQAFVCAIRSKYQTVVADNPELAAALGVQVGQRIRIKVDPDQPGTYETDALAIHYEHIATAARDQDREPDAKLPVPPLEPRSLDEGDFRDEIEAEVDALEQAEAGGNGAGPEEPVAIAVEEPEKD